MSRNFSKDDLLPLERANNKAKVEFMSETKGFGLQANVKIKQGEVIIDRERPLGATLNPGEALRCGYCWRSEFSLRANQRQMTDDGNRD